MGFITPARPVQKGRLRSSNPLRSRTNGVPRGNVWDNISAPQDQHILLVLSLLVLMGYPKARLVLLA